MVQKTIRFSESFLILSKSNSWLRFPDHVLQVGGRRMIAVRPRRPSHFDRANFFHGLLGADVVFSDEEHNALNKSECVIQQ
jgi:hypothetical protein